MARHVWVVSPTWSSDRAASDGNATTASQEDRGRGPFRRLGHKAKKHDAVDTSPAADASPDVDRAAVTDPATAVDPLGGAGITAAPDAPYRKGGPDRR